MLYSQHTSTPHTYSVFKERGKSSFYLLSITLFSQNLLIANSRGNIGLKEARDPKRSESKEREKGPKTYWIKDVEGLPNLIDKS